MRLTQLCFTFNSGGQFYIKHSVALLRTTGWHFYVLYSVAVLRITQDGSLTFNTGDRFTYNRGRHFYV